MTESSCTLGIHLCTQDSYKIEYWQASFCNKDQQDTLFERYSFHKNIIWVFLWVGKWCWKNCTAKPRLSTPRKKAPQNVFLSSPQISLYLGHFYVLDWHRLFHSKMTDSLYQKYRLCLYFSLQSYEKSMRKQDQRAMRCLLLTQNF